MSGKLVKLSLNDNWNKFIEQFSMLDVYYSQEYSNLSSTIENGTAEAIFYENDDGKVFYPYIKRKIDLNEEYLDIVTPYGYGGPVLEGDQNTIKPFYRQFNEYCTNNKIITETVRLHPLLKNDAYMKDVMDVEYIRKTTAVDLALSLEEIRKNYTSNNKRNIKKAKKEGVNVFVSNNNKKDIEIFIDLYYETMNRNNSLSYYYFDKSYFYRQMEEMLLCKSYLLLAEYKNQIIGGILLLIGNEYAHYHLGASKTEYLSLRPNNLLFDAMIEFSKSCGLKLLHLGGGYQENDSLFKFKTSFTNNNNYNYFLGKNILNKKIYKELSQIAAKNLSPISDSNYFPLYRRKN
ncbi:GNAT family N-acetyltransferase [Metabacillus idriensis]|uniref:GNAT family N-acetyltransferase n=1 Tax=Metabacillus idriensis TaxID=324768 RepID=UPI002813A483|nr:GNAT family N-acetyltransferase [Metabacillus idriensis]MDR0138031.1 GNAT family N-acetyltransferase [Metabacillus idriensis]